MALPAFVYATKTISLSLSGIPIKEFAAGSFITVELSEDSVTKHVGAQGKVTYTMNNRTDGMVTIKLSDNSISNAVLSNAYRLQTQSNGLVKPFLMLLDPMGGDRASGFGLIARDPGRDFANETGEKEWQIHIAELKFEHGGGRIRT